MEITLISLIILGALVLFIGGWFTPDVVAVCILGSLLLFGLVTPEEGISGFSNPATITVAAMFVLSAALRNTGALAPLSGVLSKAAEYPAIFLFVVMGLAAGISAFINNTATVAVMLPIILSITAKRGLPAAQFLIPLSFASQFGGVCTLIGTSTNILVSSISQEKGYGPFSMFELGQVGIFLLAAGLIYFMLIGRHLLPSAKSGSITTTYKLGEYITELVVLPESPLVGQILIESPLAKDGKIRVLEIIREKKKIWKPQGEKLQAHDVLLVRGTPDDFIELKTKFKMEIAAEFKLKDEDLQADDLVLVEALIPPRSRLIGHTLATTKFASRYDSLVLAIQRRGHVMHTVLKRIHLELGDQLLLQTRKEDLDALREDSDLLLLGERPDLVRRTKKAWIAIGIVVGVVALATFNVMPILVSALLGCLLLVLTRCLTAEESYEAVDWQVIVLLGAILPLGLALQKTGAAEGLVGWTLNAIGDMGPRAVLIVLFVATALLTELMSNNATAALLAPIAITTAEAMGISPTPLLVVIALAASTSFLTPVGYQTNTMIFNPGGYRYVDFVKVGLPLNIIFGTITIILVPMFWDLSPLKID
jgi:di/tricarboxylate transporter